MLEDYKMTQRLISAASRLAIIPGEDVLNRALAQHGELSGASQRAISQIKIGVLPSQDVCETALLDLQQRQMQAHARRVREDLRNG